MCGIVGIINGNDKVKANLSDVFVDMLWADQMRGVDGAGVFWYDVRRHEYDVVKDKDINAVLEHKDFKQAKLWIEKKPFIIGHNRAATRGERTSENNHPFDEGNVVLVHNGTMSYIPKEYDDGTKVDSHAIAKMLHKASPEEFMKKSFGAFALVWFDKVSKQLNLLRNNDRPLWLVHFKEFIIVCSEWGLGVWCGSRRGFTYTKIEQVKPFTLYQYNPFDIENPIITDLKEFSGSFVSNTYPIKPYSYGLYDDDEYSGERYWSNEDREYKTAVDNTPTDAEKYNAIDPFKYFKDTHKIVELRRSNTDDEKQRNGVVSFKKGDEIEFAIDGGVEHDKFTQFTGNLKGLPIKDYSVVGHTPMSYDELMDCKKIWSANISHISDKNNKITLYVRDAKPTDKDDTDFVYGVTPEKK